MPPALPQQILRRLNSHALDHIPSAVPVDAVAIAIAVQDPFLRCLQVLMVAGAAHVEIGNIGSFWFVEKIEIV